MDRYLHDISIAVESILANKLKSILTALGIIFGVAAVISMLAIGNGAREEILNQIKMVGVNNIVITSLFDEDEQNQDESSDKLLQKYSPGLTYEDAKAIKSIIPTVHKVSPEISENTYVIQKGRRKSARLMGVTPFYFDLFSFQLSKGSYFNDYQNTHGKKVCVITNGIKKKLFKNADPIGKKIKCGKIWLEVIGVLKKRYFAQNTDKFNFSSSEEIIYLPVNTMLMRFKNRSLVTAARLRQGSGGDNVQKVVNYHQLNKIVVQVKDSKHLMETTEILQRMLHRRHQGVEDFEISVPELLLKQEQKTKDLFNVVLGAIAGISLIVGGIGIMNIMLASVMERIKEIGTRMAIGARRSDIVVQFLAESTLISVIGGLIGVLLGVIVSLVITNMFDILTIISPFSVIIAFGVSVFIGILFGYMPAKRASERDPIESLRYE